MTDARTDLAEQLARAWNSSHEDRATAVDFWPCCRILLETGIVVAQDENLAAVPLGPFRLAVNRSSTPGRDFVEVLLPSVAASLPAGEPLGGAVAGVLSATCACFVKLLHNGVVFGRGEPDRLRWDVLIHIRRSNAAGVHPTSQEVVDSLVDSKRSAAQVGIAINWLTSEEPRVRLVVQHPGGGLECLV